MHVSHAEIVRSSADPLRTLGLDFSAAERGGSVLTWGEAVHRLAFRYLRLEERSLRHGFSADAATLAERPGVIAVAARGKSTLDMGPALIDLACGEAKRRQQALVIVDRVYGLFLLGEPLLRAARRGVAVLAAYDAPDPPFEGIGAALAVPDEGRPLLTERPVADPVSRALAVAAKFGLSAPMHAIAAPSLVILAADASKAGAVEAMRGVLSGPKSDQTSPWQGCSDFDQRLADAILNGMDCTPEDYSHYVRLAAGIRLATSDRSRGQAG
jgi:hypothetical protein